MNRTGSVVSALCAISLVTSETAAADPSAIADPSLRAFLEAFEEANRRFMNGDHAQFMQHLSQREDVAIVGGWGAMRKAGRRRRPATTGPLPASATVRPS